MANGVGRIAARIIERRARAAHHANADRRHEALPAVQISSTGVS
jgi:hypothetical protein